MFMTEENFDPKVLAEFYQKQLEALKQLQESGGGPSPEQVQKELAEIEEADKDE